VCWSVRDTPDAAHRHSLLERAVLGAERWLSPSVDRVFNVSARSVGYCATTLHWDTSRTEVLPNGIDTTRFRPDLARRAQARQALGLAADAPVIAMVANFKPVKNFPLFMEAAGQLLAERRDARFLLIGRGVERANEELQALAARHGVADRLSLTGPRDDVEALLPAADVVALTSLSEGFPNVLAEALACGVPVTSTDVGDARDIVGPGGRILPAEAPAFASAWHELLRDERLRARLGSLGRSHIERAYALDTIAARLVGRYEALLTAGR
jgi:glycosyltransferase involved in cell wall biosynthesis